MGCTGAGGLSLFACQPFRDRAIYLTDQELSRSRWSMMTRVDDEAGGRVDTDEGQARELPRG